jgi:hypothetical protein
MWLKHSDDHNNQVRGFHFVFDSSPWRAVDFSCLVKPLQINLLLMVFGRLTSMNGEEPTASYAPKKLPFII